uniref:Uncharacterized protein n=1 Tax=Arundo donax TaxID=35708 RepID=A0A0A8YPF6_ARUDO
MTICARKSNCRVFLVEVNVGYERHKTSKET